MDLALDMLSALGEAVLRLLIHPFYYVGIMLILLQYRRQIQLERRLFHSRLHYLGGEAWRLILYGFAAGTVVSLLMLFLGSSLSQEAVILLWVISFILVLFRFRFLCMAYAAGALAVLQAVLGWFPLGAELQYLEWLYQWMEQVNAAALLALAGVLHLAEAALIWLQGSRAASPLFYESKRGKVIGGFHIYGFWPLAMFLLVPSQGSGGFILPWEPLFSSPVSSSVGWTLLAVPAVLGFTDQTWSRPPQEKARRTSVLLSAYAVLVVLLALLAQWLPLFLIVAAVLTVGLHEWLIWFSRREEARRNPVFVHDSKGLKVLAVLPRSSAEMIGIQTGEIISKVNGIAVRNREQLHQALQANPAYCKLEIVNLDGEIRFAGRAMFVGDHHQLGILLCPDDEARYVVEERQRVGLLPMLFGRLNSFSGKSGNSSSGEPGSYEQLGN